MARKDLVALTDDGLIQMANAGLVKRGLREIDVGKAPALSELPDGTIESRYPDGTLTLLKAGQAPAEASCTCPSSGMCRHRIGLVIAYRHANRGDAPAPESTWDPGRLDLAAMEAALSSSARSELARLRAAALEVRLFRNGTPSAELPMATVRFLAPDNPAYARCDCASGNACAHIVLAVEAFRRSQGAAEARLGTPAAAVPLDALRLSTDAVLVRLLSEGTTSGLAAHGATIDQATHLARAQGAIWILLALESLAAQIGAYERRSALYDEAVVLALVTEIYARPLASTASALGVGEPLETAMGKTRLVSLGGRILARGRDLHASVALFDSDTGTPVHIEKVFSPEATVDQFTSADILPKFMAPGLPLRALASGQILTSAAHRRADGTVRFGSGSQGKTTLLRRGATIEPPQLLTVASLEDLRATLEARPPSFLQPRNRMASLRVFAVAEVVGQFVEPGTQTWRAAVDLANDGGRLYLKRRYDAGAPAALDVLGAAFAGTHGKLRQIAGLTWLEDGAIYCDPWSVCCDAFIAPDFESEKPGVAPPVSSPAGATDVLPAVHKFLASALHAGARRRDASFMQRGKQLALEAQTAGFLETAQRLNDWLAASTEDVAAFGRLATWMAVALD